MTKLSHRPSADGAVLSSTRPRLFTRHQPLEPTIPVHRLRPLGQVAAPVVQAIAGAALPDAVARIGAEIGIVDAAPPDALGRQWRAIQEAADRLQQLATRAYAATRKVG